MRIPIFFILLFVSTFTLASDLPSVINDGLDIYKSKGAEAFLKRWLSDSHLASNPKAFTYYVNIEEIESKYGKYEDYDVIEINTITDRVMMIYLVMNYEEGPVYVSIETYKKKSGWIVSLFNINTYASKVLPSRVHLK